MSEDTDPQTIEALAEVVYISFVKATGETNHTDKADAVDRQIAEEVVRLVRLGMIPNLTYKAS